MSSWNHLIIILHFFQNSLLYDFPIQIAHSEFLSKQSIKWKIQDLFWFKHIYFVLQLYKHTNIYEDNTSYGIRTEAKSL